MKSLALHRWLPQSLSSRLAVGFGLLLLAFIGISFLAAYFLIAQSIQSDLDEDLEEDAALYADLLNNQGIESLAAEMDRETQGEDPETEFILLFRSDGKQVHETDLTHWQSLPIDATDIVPLFNLDNEVTLQSLDVSSQSATTRVLFARLSSEHMIVIGESTEHLQDFTELLMLVFALVFLLVLPAAGLFSSLFTRRALAGIKQVSQAAVALSSGNLDHRVKAVNQVREVQTLADTFDSMALRIQTLIRDMREMTDNIAHDLRSPLGRIRLLAESVKNSNDLSPEVSDCAQKTMGECDRLIAMINTALDVAEAEAGVHHGPRTLEDFTALVVDTWDLFEASAEQNANRVSTRLVSGAFVQGQRTALQRMLSNLFDNAIKYTPAGGQINIEILHDDQDTGLLIRNTCNGIADGDQEKIFDRFQRLEPSRGRSGCGLGLSYSRAVARSHGGDIHIKSDKQSYVELIVKLPSAVTQHYPFNPQLIS